MRVRLRVCLKYCRQYQIYGGLLLAVCKDFAADGKAQRCQKANQQTKSCSGWNGKNQYIELASNISYTNSKGEVINANHDAIGNQAVAFVGTSGVQLGWLASQADMLANDWKIVE